MKTLNELKLVNADLSKKLSKAKANERAAQKGAKINAEVSRRLAVSNAGLRNELEELTQQSKMDTIRFKEMQDCIVKHKIDFEELTEIAKDSHRRYEFVRKMSPNEFKAIWNRSLIGENDFDSLIDADIKSK